MTNTANLVYSIGRVGSSSVHATLKANGIKSYQIHFLKPASTPNGQNNNYYRP